jgi:hypothetical protein
LAVSIPRCPGIDFFCDQASTPFRQPSFVPQTQLNGLVVSKATPPGQITRERVSQVEVESIRERDLVGYVSK